MQLSRKSKIIIMIVCSIIFIGSLVFITKELKRDRIQKKIEVDYTISSSAEFDYKVLIKQNELIKESVLESGGAYITELIKEIDGELRVSYSSERQETVEGHYTINAVIDSTVNENKILWSKEFEISKESFKKKNTVSDILKIPFKIDVTLYRSMIEEINEVSGNAGNISFRIDGTVDLKSENDSYEYQHEVSMNIPIIESYFEIQEDTLKDSNEIPVQREVMNEIPVNWRKIVFLSIIGFISILIGILAKFYTKTIELNERQKVLKNIFNEYGDKMVAVTKFTAEVTQDIISVRDMKDLVRISDEMVKPILYKYSNNEVEIETFFILADNVYVYKLPDRIGDNEKEIVKKGNREEEEITEAKVK